MRIYLSFLIICFLVLSGCKGSEKVVEEETKTASKTEASEESTCIPVVLDTELFNTIQYKPVEVLETRIEGSSLFIKFNFSGCTYDEIDLVWNNMLKKSYPGQASLKLGYSRTGSCDEIQTKESCFDLKSFVEYKKVMLSVNGAPGVLFDVTKD